MNHDKDYVELYNRMAQNEHFASSTKSVEENITDKMNDRLKKLERSRRRMSFHRLSVHQMKMLKTGMMKISIRIM